MSRSVSAPSSSRPPLALAWLERLGGDQRYVERETRIGRGGGNDIQLDHPTISRDHALIRRVDGGYVISDLGSANGTFVNGQRVYAPQPLSTGDRVSLAGLEFTFHVNVAVAEAGAGAAADPPTAASISQFLTMSAQVDAQNYLEGDLRVVTVLFLDLCGFTALSENMSPEQVTLVVNQCFRHLTETAARFGGFVDKYVGDAMLVLFGAPQAHEDDPERAVRAAIAMQQTLATFSQHLRQRSGIALSMRVGICTGEVLAGRVGSGSFSGFTVMGDTVNLASRLEETARVGHILVSDSTYRLTRGLIRYTALPSMAIRGKHDAIASYEVIGFHTGAPATEALTPPPLVGQQAATELLAERYAASGGVRAAMVVGDVGSGKARVIEHLRRVHQPACWVTVRCPDDGQLAPGSAVRLVHRALLDKLRAERGAAPYQRDEDPADASGTTVVDHEPAPPRPAEHADLNPERPAATIAALLRELSRERRATLVLERADRADADSLAVLRRATVLLEEADVLLLMTGRATLGEAWPEARVVRLQPLSAPECRQLIAQLLGSDTVEPETVEHLGRWSSGLPRVLEEAVAAGLADGNLRCVDGTWRMTFPVTVGGAHRLRAIVQSSLDRLDPAEHQLLKLLAIVGPSGRAGLLADAIDSPAAVDGLLGHLVELGYLIRDTDGPDPIYAFHHEFTRAVIRASMPQLEQRRVHERIALALQARYDPHQPDPLGLKAIADQFAQAGQHWRAVEYLVRSADLAAAVLDPAAAVAHYRAILDEARTLNDLREQARLQVELHERIGELLLRDGNLAEAQIAFEVASEQCASDERRAELQLKIATSGLRRGHPRRVLQLTDAVLATGASSTTQARAHALATLSLAARGDVPQATGRAERALRLAVETRSPSVVGVARFAAGRLQLVVGDLAAAASALRLSAEARQQAGEWAARAESQVLLGLVLCELGELDQAEAALRAGLAAAHGPADQTVRPTRPSAVEQHDRWTLAFAAFVLARVLARRGELERAGRHLADAFRAAERMAARELSLDARLDLIDLDLVGLSTWNPAAQGVMLDNLSGVTRGLQSVLEASTALELQPLVCRTQIGLSRALCARAAVSSASAADARHAFRWARQALTLANHCGLRLQAALARRALGHALMRLDHPSPAAEHLDRAAAQLEQLGARVELVRTLVDAARDELAHARAPRIGKVRDRLARAIRLADALGLATDRSTAEQLLAGLHG